MRLQDIPLLWPGLFPTPWPSGLGTPSSLSRTASGPGHAPKGIAKLPTLLFFSCEGFGFRTLGST